MIRIADFKRLWELRFLQSFCVCLKREHLKSSLYFCLHKELKKGQLLPFYYYVNVLFLYLSGSGAPEYTATPQMTSDSLTHEALVTASIVAHHFCQVIQASDWSTDVDSPSHWSILSIEALV